MTFARASHIAFLVCVNNPLVLTGGDKFGQSEGIPDSGIPERLPLRKFHGRSLVLSPSLPSFFPALSLALVFARAPLSERLGQATYICRCCCDGDPSHKKDIAWVWMVCFGAATNFTIGLIYSFGVSLSVFMDCFI